jgi:hypothetical protein
MSDQKLDAIITELGQIKVEVIKASNSLSIIDKRLSLIEQRLTNIEPWIAVDNKHLEYQSQKTVLA